MGRSPIALHDGSMTADARLGGWRRSHRTLERREQQQNEQRHDVVESRWDWPSNLNPDATGEPCLSAHGGKRRASPLGHHCG